MGDKFSSICDKLRGSSTTFTACNGFLSDIRCLGNLLNYCSKMEKVRLMDKKKTETIYKNTFLLITSSKILF